MANEYVKLWLSYEAYFQPLGDAEVGRLVLGMMKYKSTGTEPVFNGNERFVWPAIKADISPDMSDVPTVEVDYTVDAETCEILEPSEQ